jgi:hypothetical protein
LEENQKADLGVPSLEFAGEIPHAAYHHAAGDIVSWSGIKRCGAAMHHGHYAAVNIYQKMLREQDPSTHVSFLELQRNVPSMIGLAVGSQAVSYSPSDGVQSGEEVCQLFFGDDLGFNSKIFPSALIVCALPLANGLIISLLGLHAIE